MPRPGRMVVVPEAGGEVPGGGWAFW